MHPEIYRQLGAQRGSDMRVRAERVRVARAASRALRAARRASRATEEFVAPAIPDYVDGSFKVPAAPAGEDVPAGRQAA
jgi:hypothetical protein